MSSQSEWINHIKKNHCEIGEEGRQRLEAGSRIPKLRPADICPICLEQFKPETSLARESLEDDDNFEGKFNNEEKRQHSTPERQRRVGFSVPESLDGESDAGSGSRDEEFQMKQRPDHAWAGNHIAQHLKSLAFFFSSRFDRGVDHESNAPGMSGENSTQLLDSDSLPALDFSVSETDFPRLPDSAFPVEGGPSTDETSSDTACIEDNRATLLAIWGGHGRLPEPNLPREDFELLYPGPASEESGNGSEKWPRSTHAVVCASFAFIILELCRRALTSDILDDWVQDQCVPDLKQISEALDGFRDAAGLPSLKSGPLAASILTLAERIPRGRNVANNLGTELYRRQLNNTL